MNHDPEPRLHTVEATVCETGLHTGPALALAEHGVKINGETVVRENIDEMIRRYCRGSPPVSLSHQSADVLEAARKVVASGDAKFMHNSHKAHLHLGAACLTHDVIRGLGALDAYVNDARVRDIAKVGPTGRYDVDLRDDLVSLGARNAEELAVAVEVVTRGTSEPAREWQLRGRRQL